MTAKAASPQPPVELQHGVEADLGAGDALMRRGVDLVLAEHKGKAPKRPA